MAEDWRIFWEIAVWGAGFLLLVAVLAASQHGSKVAG